MRPHLFIPFAIFLAVSPAITIALPEPQESNLRPDGAFPTCVTLPADSITSRSARLRAMCDTRGVLSSAQLEWGLSLDPDTGTVITDPWTLQPDTGTSEIDETVGPLMPGQTYKYRAFIGPLSWTNHTYGDIVAFTTKSDTSAYWMSIPLRVAAEGTPGFAIRFGVHSYATDCEDPGLGELPLPPRPPEGSMETRFMGRCLGLGAYVDLRPYVSPAQADTYHVSFLSGGTGYPMTISWPALSASYAGPVSLQTTDSTVDMLETRQYSITNTQIEDIRIIAQRPRPQKICPSVVSDTVSAPIAGSVLLSATVYPHGLPTDGWFEWGVSDRYGNHTAPQPLGDTIGAVTLTAALSGLTGNSQYHYRAVARNMAATIYGPDKVFTTPGPAPVQLPRTFMLYQNYPNPFNPTTLIRYDLPADAHVVITVYDLLGRPVQTLVDGAESAGFKSAFFDARGLATGMYLYRLTAGGYTATGKAVVTR